MHATGHMKSLKLSRRQQQVDEDEDEEEEPRRRRMKTRERKARQRELNDFLSGRPIWSKKEVWKGRKSPRVPRAKQGW